MDIEKIRRQNINYWADKIGRPILASKAGYKDTIYINQLCGGHGSFGSRTARKLEAALQLPNGWFDRVHDDSIDAGSTIPTRKVPLISWVAAGSWCESPDSYEPGDAEEWLDCPFPFSAHSFCLAVVGDSMFPDYREGEYILVDPAVEARHNDDIVAREPDGKHTFKRLQITPDGMYLLALNPDHPNRKIEIPADTQICGVVTGSWMRRRR